MARRKVLVLEMRVRHLPPEPPDLPNHLKGGNSMRHNRLKLVVPEDSTKAATDGSTESRAVPATPDSSVLRLRVVDADGGPLPDDAA
jgi:hypothetical protein